MNALIAENKEYEDLNINIIDEHAHPEIADKYDYYLVPTYYVGDEKVHEGAASLKKIKKVLDTAATLLK
jgi:disulfide oxidoreductase YuzD